MQWILLCTSGGRIKAIETSRTNISLTVDHLSLRQQYYFEILKSQYCAYILCNACIYIVHKHLYFEINYLRAFGAQSFLGEADIKIFHDDIWILCSQICLFSSQTNSETVW